MRSVRRGRTRRSPPRPRRSPSCIASIPFIVNGRVGILGVGLVNDDMATHLLIADWLNTRVGADAGADPPRLSGGAARACGRAQRGARHGPDRGVRGHHARDPGAHRAGRRSRRSRAAAAFRGSSRRRWWRCPIWPPPTSPRGRSRSRSRRCSSSPSRCCCPAATTVRGAMPLGVIAAGAVYTYSFPGLFWLARRGGRLRLAIAAGRGASGADPGSSAQGCEVTTSWHSGAFRGGRPATLLAAAVALASWSFSPPPTGPAGRLHPLPRLPRLDDQQRARQPAPPASRRSRRWGSGRPATSGCRPATRACPRPPSTSARWSPPRRWPWACRGGFGATAPRCPRPWRRRS